MDESYHHTVKGRNPLTSARVPDEKNTIVAQIAAATRKML